ncbi:MAG TPA: class I SAM-dependent methyltransferase [Acidimicrobiales bacterium]|nr:class I SAM-dependent methyltransferase [Acidimicrobiales bacterium]
MDRAPWSHNLHYHRLIVGLVPEGCRRALDVGCGEGRLARDLRTRAGHVTALDRHAPTLARAAADDGDGIAWVLGDLLSHPFVPESFDLVASVATLHHMDTAAALARMGSLVRPGGTLVVVGLARARSVADIPYELAGLALTRVYNRIRRPVAVGAPVVWPPPLTYGQTRAAAQATLPGVDYRRRALHRYTLVWTKRPPHQLGHYGSDRT